MLNMSQLDRFEELAQRLVEGTFKRLFQAGEQPQNRTATTREVLSIAASLQAAERWALHLNGTRLSLGQPVVNIGRALDNDLILDDLTASRYHAQLRWRQGQYFLYPPDSSRRASGSTPHTTLNGEMVAGPPLPLHPGDTLSLGQSTLVVTVSD